MAGVLVAAILAGGLHGGAAQAQADRLPDLGSASGDELSGGAERRLGESIMRELRQQGVVWDDAEFNGFLNRFAARLTGSAQARGLSFELFAVRDPSINAFALPGGFIGVHTGLIAASSSESELATVLAHEIGHVTQRHIARMLSQQRQASMMSLAALVLGALAARSSVDAAIGISTLGDTFAARQMMSFSRDSEREADRVGLEMLAEAGFDVRAAPRFFERLQAANRYNESRLPTWFRTHPVTGERMTDLQLRIRDMRPVTHVDGLDFRLIRARAIAVGSDSVDDLQASRRRFDDAVLNDGREDAAAWFGLASVASAQRDWRGADAALAKARALIGVPHPYVARLEIANALAADRPAEAVRLAKAALERMPDTPSIVRLHAQALLGTKAWREAAAELRERTSNDMRGDPDMWRMLSEAYQGLRERGMAHRAAAERYLLLGLRLPALEQLRLAVKAGDLDFYNGSIVDAKLREQEQRWREELKERREQ
ncbi:MAG: M48 family metalloprotease [Lautropia sp.]